MQAMVTWGWMLGITMCLMGATGSASAAEGQPPCLADMQRLCPVVPALNGFVQECLRSNGAYLSPECRKHVGDITRDSNAVRVACYGDLARFCPNIDRARSGARLGCLVGHRDALDPKCRETLDDQSRD
jgi:hypothetical protein